MYWNLRSSDYEIAGTLFNITRTGAISRAAFFFVYQAECVSFSCYFDYSCRLVGRDSCSRRLVSVTGSLVRSRLPLFRVHLPFVSVAKQ